MQVALDDYVWAAGVATELVNTTAEVWRGDDRLPDLAALVAFADLHSGRSGKDDDVGALPQTAHHRHATDPHGDRPGTDDDVGALPQTAHHRHATDPHGDRSGQNVPAGALSQLARRGRAADLEAVHALRITVRDLIEHPDRDHDHLIAGATALTSAAQGATLIPDPAHEHRARWAIPLRDEATVADALSVICGIGILGVVHTLGEQRFRSCGAPTCRGVFIDTTRPGRRRYCMPGLCGNRTNVANHRARRAAAR